MVLTGDAFGIGFTAVRTGTDDYDQFLMKTGAVNVHIDGEAEQITSLFTLATDLGITNYTRNQVGALFDAIFNGVTQYYWFDWTDGTNSYYWDGAVYGGLLGYLTGALGASDYDDTANGGFANGNGFLFATLKGSFSEYGVVSVTPEHEEYSYCNNNSLYLRWNLVDKIQITYDGGTNWYDVGNATTQNEVRDWLNAVYPQDNYLFAYNANTGEICVEWQAESSTEDAGTMTFDVTLQESILVGDEVTANVPRWGIEGGRWL